MQTCNKKGMSFCIILQYFHLKSATNAVNCVLTHVLLVCLALQSRRTAALWVYVALAATLGAIKSLMHAYHVSVILFPAKSQCVVGVLSGSHKERERLW